MNQILEKIFKKKIIYSITVIYCIFLFLYAWISSSTTAKDLYGFQFEIPVIIGGIFILLGSLLVLHQLMKEKMDVASLYLISAIVLYSLLLWVQTPMHGMDIRFHWDSSYVLANDISLKELRGSKELGKDKIYDIRTEDNFIQFTREKSSDVYEIYGMIQQMMFQKLEPEGENIVGQKLYGGISKPLYFYLPQAIGINLARMLGMNVFWLMFISRLMICGTAIFVTYRSIKNIPFGKEILYLSSLIPTTMMLSVTVSRDVLILAFSFFYISKCLQIAFGEKVRISDYVVMFIAFLALAPYKMVYVALLLLVGIIIYKLVASNSINKKYIIFFAFVMIAAVGFYVITNYSYISNYLTGANKYSMGENAPFTVPYILNNPLSAIKVFVNTIIFSSVRYYANMFAISDLGAGLSKEMVVMYSIFLLIFVISSFDKSEKQIMIAIPQRVIMFLTCAAVSFLILFAYLLCTPYDNELIIGVQGRYFTPILPLIALCFWRIINVKNKGFQNLNWNLIKKITLGAVYGMSLFVIVNMYVWTVTK